MSDLQQQLETAHQQLQEQQQTIDSLRERVRDLECQLVNARYQGFANGDPRATDV